MMCCLSHDSVPCIPSLLHLSMSPSHQDFKFLMGMARLKLQGILSIKKVLASPAPVASNLELNNVVEPNKDEKFQQYFPILDLFAYIRTLWLCCEDRLGQY